MIRLNITAASPWIAAVAVSCAAQDKTSHAGSSGERADSVDSDAAGRGGAAAGDAQSGAGGGGQTPDDGGGGNGRSGAPSSAPGGAAGNGSDDLIDDSDDDELADDSDDDDDELADDSDHDALADDSDDDDELADDSDDDDELADDLAPEPSLIASIEGAYFQAGEVQVVQTGTADFTVDTSTMHQTWHGWGGTFNEQGWYALSDLTDAERDRAMELLFSKSDGLGLDWGAIPIGPSNYALDRYTLSAAPGEFDISRDESYLIPYIRAAQAVNAATKYWARPWTPPPWAKTGDTENGGYDRGSFDPQFFQEYADYLVTWIQTYEALGIPIDFVMPQSQPGLLESHPSCAFGPAFDSTTITTLTDPVTLGTFVDEHLFPSFDAANLSTEIWFGALTSNAHFDDYFWDMMTKDSAGRLGGVGLQWETILDIDTVPDDYLIMQTEHRAGNYPFGTTQGYVTHDDSNAMVAPNDFNYAWESWDLFKSWIDGGVHLYSAWNMVLDTQGFSLNDVRPWKQNALLVVDHETKELITTPFYWVFRHLAQYVDLGAVRVEIDGNALAFQNPDGSVVAVIRIPTAGPHILSIDGMLLAFESPGDGWVTVNWQGN